MKVRRSRGVRTLVTVLVAAMIVVGAAGLTVWYLASQTSVDDTNQQASNPPAPEPVPISINANTLFFGDIYWGRYMNDWAMASDLKTAYPFSRLDEFKRKDYDVWIANLECPTVADFQQTSIEEDTTLSFNCNPDYLPEMAKWFSIVSLANNHTDNRGPEGFAETKKHLEENGVQYVGNPDPTVTKDACEVVALPVTVTYSDASEKRQHLPVALCNYHGVFQIPPQSSIQQIARYAEYMPVISLAHMGTEYKTGPDQLKTNVYRSMIDEGADMVLGGHPHWVQTTEAYKGKLIAYSMGNFIFDQQYNTEVTRSASINVVMNTTDSSELLSKWLALGEQCATFQDTCLEQAQQDGLTKLSMTYKFAALGGTNTNRVTRPATAAEQASILDRLNWKNTMNQLQPPQSEL